MTVKSGRMSASSAQHCRIIFMASGCARFLLTEGRIRGGGFFTFSRISVKINKCDKDHPVGFTSKLKRNSYFESITKYTIITI